MRTMLALVVMLYSAAAFAQSSPPGKPPMYGGRPLVQVKPRDTTARGVPAAKPAGKPQSTAVKLQVCLDLDDGTKDRLNCYDAIFPPKPNPKAAAAKGVADCRFKKEEDDRLGGLNYFPRWCPKIA